MEANNDLSKFPNCYKTLWLATISFFFGEALAPVNVLKASKYSIIILWVLWSTVVILLSEMYQGEMFSSMSVTVEPDIPNSLESLFETNGMLIGTTEGCLTAKRAWTSCLLSSPVFETSHKKSSRLADIIEKIENHTQWILMDIRFKKLLFRPRNSFLQYNPDSFIPFPSRFAIIDEKDLQMQYGFVNAFKELRSYWISKLFTVPLIGFNDYYDFPANYFNLFLIRGLAQIIESGLYNRWAYHYNVQRRIDAVAYTYCKINFDGRVEDENVDCYDMDTKGTQTDKLFYHLRRKLMFCSCETSSLARRIEEEFEVIGSNVYMRIMPIWLAFAAGTAMVLIAEIAWAEWELNVSKMCVILRKLILKCLRFHLKI